jgi:CRP/FNR family transcriptional regulator, anaerobic regulatory protein
MNDFLKIKQVLFHFHPLSENEWNDFSDKLQLKTALKGQLLLQEGQVENTIRFLLKGATRHYFINKGEEYTLDFHFEGDFITAYYSFINREPSSVYIEVLEHSEMIIIDYLALQEFYKCYHNGDKIGRLFAEFQYSKRLKKEMDFLALNAQQLYADLMLKNPDLIAGISVKHMASYLGIKPESLSRIRKIYQKNNIHQALLVLKNSILQNESPSYINLFFLHKRCCQ